MIKKLLKYADMPLFMKNDVISMSSPEALEKYGLELHISRYCRDTHKFTIEDFTDLTKKQVRLLAKILAAS